MSRLISTRDFVRNPELVKAYSTLSAAIASGNDEDLVRCLKDYIDTAHRIGLLVRTAVAMLKSLQRNITVATTSKKV